MADREQARARRAFVAVGILVGIALSSLATISLPLLDLAYHQAGDPPVIVPFLIWPFAPVKFAIGLLFGPLAGVVAGLSSQAFDLTVSGFDLTATWNWVLAGAVGGFVAGWLPRHLPGAWGPAGARRLAGAALTGVAATAIGFAPIFLDPYVRPNATFALALGEYVTVVVPTAILSALMLPLVLAAGLAIRVQPANARHDPVAAARPGWRPFAIALALAVAVPVAPLYLAPYVRLIGPASAAAGPVAAPGPQAAGGGVRAVSVSLGAPTAADRSCDAEGDVRSPSVSTTVDLTVYNETGASLGILWLDYDGKRDETVPIEADGPLFVHSAPGHVFMLTGPAGGCVMIFKVLGSTSITVHFRA